MDHELDAMVATGEAWDEVARLSARQYEGRTIISAVTRLHGRLMGESYDSVCEEAIWRDTTLEIPSDGVACYHNLITGECLPLPPNAVPRIPLSDLFRNFPVAILIGEPDNSTQSCT
jgi:maltooligosyltrehalose synthase